MGALRRDDFRRRRRAEKACDICGVAKSDQIQLKRRRNHKLSAGADRSLRLRSGVTGETRHVLGGHRGEVTAAVFAPAGTSFASAGASFSVGTKKREIRMSLFLLGKKEL